MWISHIYLIKRIEWGSSNIIKTLSDVDLSKVDNCQNSRHHARSIGSINQYTLKYLPDRTSIGKPRLLRASFFNGKFSNSTWPITLMTTRFMFHFNSKCFILTASMMLCSKWNIFNGRYQCIISTPTESKKNTV